MLIPVHPIEKVCFVCSFPSGKISGNIAAYLISCLICWVDSLKFTRVLNWDACFRLPNGNTVALGNVSLERKRFKQSVRSYTKVIPDLAIQVKSSNEQLLSLHKNIQQLLDLGTQIGVIINPDRRTFTVYRVSGEVTVLTDGDIFTVPELLPGWEIPISRVWASQSV